MTIMFNMPARGSCSVPAGVPIARISNRIIGVRSFRVMGEKLSPKLLKCSSPNRFARLPHQAQVHVQVVPRHQPQPENLVGPKQMPDVRPREILTGITSARFLQRPEVLAKPRVADRVRAVRRKHLAVSPR